MAPLRRAEFFHIFDCRVETLLKARLAALRRGRGGGDAGLPTLVLLLQALADQLEDFLALN
jgi:hypothetical protein